MNTAADSQQISPSVALGGSPMATTIANTITPSAAAAPALASRNSSSIMRLLTARPRGRSPLGHLELAPALHRADERHLVGVLQVTPDRNAAGDAGDRLDVGGEALGEVHRRGLAFQRRVRGQHDLFVRRAFTRARLDPIEQLSYAQPIRTDPIHWRDGTVEHVVSTAEGARPLEGQDVERLLNDTQPAVVTSRVEADRADRPIGDVEARRAVDDLVANRRQRRRERASLAVGCSKNVISEPLRGLRAYAWESGEGLDQPYYGLGQARSHDLAEAGYAQAAGNARHLLGGDVAHLAEAVVDGGRNEVLQHLDVVGIDGRRIDRH